MDGLLQKYLVRGAERHGDDVALMMGDEQLTYHDLDAESSRLARMLKDVGCRRGDRICLLAPKTPAAIAAMLASLKADCAYVPIDTDSPAERVQHVVRAAEPRVVLTSAAATGLLDDLARTGVLTSSTLLGSLGEHLYSEHYNSTFARIDWGQFDAHPPAARNGEHDIAHILFTSGSTGIPKGVMITHANVTSFVSWANAYLGMGRRDRWSGHPPLHFDLSTYDIYGTLASGAQLHLVPATLNLLPHKLAAFIRDSELTRWFSVPSILSYMVKFGAVRQDDFPALEKLLWCGEVLPTPVLMELMQRLPHVAFTNLYGPTEATIASSYHTVLQPPTNEAEDIPIGRACDGEDLLILDEQQRAVPAGEIGDLYITGMGLSPGYWKDPHKTSEVFLESPRSQAGETRMYRTGDLASWDDTGLAHFHGRADFQIKHRGYRIELGEIEAALNTLDGVRECAVVGVATAGFEGTQICCAYAPASHNVQVRTLRARLRDRLPSYMIPSRWREMELLPKNANGKVDRKVVKEWFEDEERRVRRD
jgi:amino acid adenylation domain-containing protein